MGMAAGNSLGRPLHVRDMGCFRESAGVGGVRGESDDQAEVVTNGCLPEMRHENGVSCGDFRIEKLLNFVKTQQKYNILYV